MKKITTVILVLCLAFVCGCTKPTSTATPTAETEKEFKASSMVKNAELWNGEYMFDDEFKFVVEYFDMRPVEAGMGTNYAELGGDFLHNVYSTGEWGTFLAYGQGFTDGVMSDLGWEHLTDVPLETKEDALNRVLYLLNLLGDRKYTSMNCGYPWMHYAGMAGFEVLGLEVGAGCESWHFKMAMTRGAAKQYSTPWFIDFSMWLQDTFPDYNSGAEGDGGHTLSSMERTMLLAYVMGADATIAEGGQGLAFCTDGSVSIYGELLLKLNNFTKEYSDLGTAYTPIAIILDKYHGMTDDSYSKVFYVFDRDEYETNLRDLLNEVIYPGTMHRQGPHGEQYAVSNGRYGDSFDFVLQDVSAELLATYPAIMMTGDFVLSDEEMSKYAEYVYNGGKIILNTAYVDKMAGFPVELPRTLNGEKYAIVEYGEGAVLIYGKGGFKELRFNDDGSMEWCEPDDFKFDDLEFILDDIMAENVPFTFSQDVEHAITVKDGALYVYLANNDGLYKSYKTYANPVTIEAEGMTVLYNGETTVTWIDERKAMDITVEYTGEYQLHGVTEIYNDKEVSLDGQKATIHLAPGDCAVLEFKIGKQN